MNNYLKIITTNGNKTYERIAELKESDGNNQKAIKIFGMLSEFEYNNINDECNIGDYYIESTDIICAFHDETFECYHYDGVLHKDGFELGEAIIDNIISIHCVNGNKDIKLDFTGCIDATNDSFYKFNLYIKGDDKMETERKIYNEIFEKYGKKYDIPYVYDESDPEPFNSESDYYLSKDKYKYMIEIFSDLVDPDNVDYQAAYGPNSKYFRDCIKKMNEAEDLGYKIQEEYKDKVYVVVSDFNDGCQFGCAIYIYILKQEEKLNIHGALWVNGAKYEYVDYIIITDEEVEIYYEGRIIGCIMRDAIITMQEQDVECSGHFVDVQEALPFDLKTVGDL